MTYCCFSKPQFLMFGFWHPLLLCTILFRDKWLAGINTDGSCLSDGRIAAGGVLRDASGAWLAGFTHNLGMGSSFSAELWGILSGIKLATRMGIKRLLVESDNLVAINRISDCQALCMSSRNLIKAILRLRPAFEVLSFSHIYREQNRVADRLAAAGHGGICARDKTVDFYVDISFATVDCSSKKGKKMSRSSGKGKEKQSDDNSQSQPLHPDIPNSSTGSESKRSFVWPWMGIVANVQRQFQGGRWVGESGSKLKNELTAKGFDPVKVHPLWSHAGHSGFAIVEFKTEWDGFSSAIMFDKEFKVNHCGKEDYFNPLSNNRGERLYGWVASDDDYNSQTILGGYLRKNGNLKTADGKEAEDRQKDSNLMINLSNSLQMKTESLAKMKVKDEEADASLNNLIEEIDSMFRKHDEEIGRMQLDAHFQRATIYLNHEERIQKLEAERKDLERRERQVEDKEIQNNNVMRNLHYQKEENKKAIAAQKEASEELWMLAERQEREKEQLRQKILELQKNLDARQKLELEIEGLKGELEVTKHMQEQEEEMKKRMDQIENVLKEKEEQLDELVSLNQTLMVKHRMDNDQLQDAHKELISYLSENSCGNTRDAIVVKKMGELDNRPFLAAAKRKFSPEHAEIKAAELCSLWDEYLRDPNWYPFKIIEKDGRSEEILDDDDEKLKELKNEFGDEVYDAVLKTLKEINEYNPSGRYIIKEIWNSKENKKATLKEGVACLLEEWKSKKSRKN
ncbi:factor of DNA methylation 4-like [Euphorbia lathyris]|uniref:factor of DNA methylation 4-like n=1 Tax=Euphorbia lathyris TaxID=212925 RepID=UPI003314394E